ncbi:acetyl-CoA carboxylase biotin carboxyl carrier protein subunit [Nonomuraea recticatena]|uniref:acetyl-CoA carboxylase biotin carboxyl carrier protein subunit n=1 Tax=Nonomuraea recticatena TaxID=46178 RepID=UPI003614C2C7
MTCYQHVGALPLRGTVVSVEVAQGDLVRQGAPIAIVESMKMEHVVEAPQAGIVGRVAVGPGDTVAEGALLVHLDPVPAAAEVVSEAAEIDLESVRPDLASVMERHAKGLDQARPEAVRRRHASGHRTARRTSTTCATASWSTARSPSPRSGSAVPSRT